jgi:hypothetical protein
MVQMTQSEIEEWREYGASLARTHVGLGYDPLPPNAAAFMQDGRCHVGRYACYLRAYRWEFFSRGIALSPLRTIRALVPDLPLLFHPPVRAA